MNKFKKQVSAQFIQDTIPESKDSDCPRCQMLEVKIERLERLVANMMQGVESIEGGGNDERCGE